jgi:uncharacterized protein (TIGR02646 family)
MHKLKPLIEIPSGFIEAVQRVKANHPVNSDGIIPKWWDFFHNEERTAYNELVNAFRLNQHSICAYCERKVDVNSTKKEIDHFIPKSSSTIEHDYTFDLSNLFLCCKIEINKLQNSCGLKKASLHPMINRQKPSFSEICLFNRLNLLT